MSDKSNLLEMFLALNVEAFKKGLNVADTSLRNLAGGTSKTFAETKVKLQENLVATRNYNAELREQSGIVQTLRGQVIALVGAYLGFRSIAGVVNIIKTADSAAFTLESSLRAASRQFSNVGNIDTWTAAIGRMSSELRIYSKSELKTAVASTIDMTKRLGFTSEQMETLIRRTADLSAGKTDLSGGIERVTSAMRGEAESAEYLGLTLNEDYVKGWHEAHNAHGKAWKDLSDLEKAQARLKVFLEQATPFVGKAADSVTTLAGAYSLTKARIQDAIGENSNAVEATKQLANVIGENAEKLDWLATTLLKAATETMKFVLENKEAVVTVGLLAAGVGGLSVVISSLTTVWGFLNTVMLATTGMKLVPWLTSLVTTLKSTNIAALTLKGTIGALSGLFLAWTVGWDLGKLLNQFAPVQKGMTALIYWADRVQLAAQKMWAALSGGDVEAIDRKIEIAKQAYEERLKEIDQEAAEKEKPKAPAPAEPQAAPSPEKPKADEGSINGFSRLELEAMDTWDESKLTPERKAALEKYREEKKKSEEAGEEAEKEKDNTEEAAKKESDEKKLTKKQATVKQETQTQEDAGYSEPSLLAKERSGQLAREKEERLAREKEKEKLRKEEEAERDREEGKDEGHSSSMSLASPGTDEQWQKSLDNAKAYEERMQQAHETVAESSKKSAEEWAQAETQAAEKAKSAFQKYADKVRSLQDEISGREKSLAEEMDGLDNRGTAESKWRRKAKEAKDYEKAAKAAMKAGDLEKALSLSDQAKAAYSSLKGGAGEISDKMGDQAALRGVKSSGMFGIDIAKAIQAATAKTALTNMPGGDLFGDLSGRIRGQLAAVANGGPDQPAGKGAAPVSKVVELRFPGGSLQGNEDAAEAFLNLMAQAGMNAG